MDRLQLRAAADGYKQRSDGYTAIHCIRVGLSYDWLLPPNNDREKLRSLPVCNVHADSFPDQFTLLLNE